MKCPKCKTSMGTVMIKTWGAKRKAKSYQCPQCDYYEFDQESAKKVIQELRESTLQLQHKIIKLSKGRLGMYFSKDIVTSLNLKGGEQLKVSVPDKDHILLERVKSKL